MQLKKLSLFVAKVKLIQMPLLLLLGQCVLIISVKGISDMAITHSVIFLKCIRFLMLQNIPYSECNIF